MLSLMKPLPFDTQRVTKAAAGLGSEQTRPRPRQSRLGRQTLRLGPRCAPQSGGAPRPAAKQWPRATVPPQAVALECFRGPATRRAPRCRPAAHPIRHRTPHAAPVARAKGTAGIAPPLPRRMSCCLLQASTWQRLAPALLLGPPSSGKGWGGGGAASRPLGTAIIPITNPQPLFRARLPRGRGASGLPAPHRLAPVVGRGARRWRRRRGGHHLSGCC